MAIYRRRHHKKYLLPAITAFSASVLLLLAAISFLTPPPIEHHSVLVRRLKTAANTNDLVISDQFHIPSGGDSSRKDLWQTSLSKYYYGCSNASQKFQNANTVSSSSRILMIVTSGGLNQQRTGITDAVVAARILNATLVVPKLDQKSFWKDASDFHDIFDVKWFISSLASDVKIISRVPRKGGKTLSPYNMRVPRKCTVSCYVKRVLPVLSKKRVVQLSKFDYRLANRLDVDLQKLRCRVNYHALRFIEPILQMGRMLVERMHEKSRHFIALHLRFEPDMLAFSGCYYGGGEKERKELGAIRRRWKTLHKNNPDKERRQGKCPLTPEEVGLMLRALGFGSDVHIYVASGEVYGGDETIAPLKILFPNLHSKETLTRRDELAPYVSFSSRMAALDFTVCDESDVFVTNNNGNMAKILAGRRKYYGHKRTIRPNAKKLYSLFMNRANMTWENFALKVRAYQRGFMGEPNEVRPGRGEFHENPSSCICEKPEAQTVIKMRGKGKRSEKKGMNNNSEPSEDHFSDEESDWIEMDYRDDHNLTQSGMPDRDEEELDPDIEELFSD